MKIRIQVIAFRREAFPPTVKGDSFEQSLEGPLPLQDLFEKVLKIHPSEKVVLVNGRYVSPGYALQENDLVQILPMLDGG